MRSVEKYKSVNDRYFGHEKVMMIELEKAQRMLEWQPTIPVREGVGQLIRWVRDNKNLFEWFN